ncbi:glycosyltransferase family 2 protein [Nakamurella sp. GG22]
MGAPPDISVIVAAYNAGRYLDDLARQLAGLTVVGGVEFILVDDGSTDGSAGRLREIAGALPEGRYLQTGTNVGVAAARNRGLEQASGEYVWFVDCDDVWNRSILQVLHRRLQETGADIAVCRADLVSESGEVLRHLDRVQRDEVVDGGVLLDRVLNGSVHGYLWNKMFRRSVLPADWFPPLSSQSDLAGLIRLLPRISAAAFVAQDLYSHVVRKQSITTSRNPDLANLVRCGDAMEQSLREMRRRPDTTAARYFFTKIIRYSVCNTGCRLSVGDVATLAVQQQARDAITLPDVLAVARVNPRDGASVAVLRYLPPLYRTLLARRWRRIGHRYFAAT